MVRAAGGSKSRGIQTVSSPENRWFKVATLRVVFVVSFTKRDCPPVALCQRGTTMHEDELA